MPSINLTAPDGRSFTIEGPPDATDEQLFSKANELKVQLEAEDVVSKERAAGFTPLPNPGVGIPVLGGLIDDISAGVESLPELVKPQGNFSEAFTRNRAVQQARERAARQDNPLLGLVGDIGAGVVTGGAVLRGTGVARTALGRIANNIKIGGSVGAADFATRSERLSDVPENAVQGGVVGGVAGGLVPPALGGLVRLARSGAGGLRTALTRVFQGADDAADDILSRRIAAEGSNPAAKELDLAAGQAAARLDANSRATLPETLADTSPAMQALLGSARRSGGEAKNFIDDFLQSRQRGPANPFGPVPPGPPLGQAARITDQTERALLLRTSNSARRTERSILTQQSQDGRRLYAEAFRNFKTSNDGAFDLSPSLSQLSQVIDASPPAFAAKLNRARNLFLKRQAQATTIGRPTNPPTALRDLREFDNAKKALDDMIGVAQRGGQGNLARQLVQFKNSLLDDVHGFDGAGNATRNLTYLEARQTWGSAAENREAIELGRAAMRENAEVSAEQFRELNPGQRQLFRIGFLESLRNTIGRKRPGNDITQIFQEGRVRDLMNEIIPQPRGRTAVFAARREQFGELQRREQRLFSTGRQVVGGSPTQDRQIADLEFAGDTMTQFMRFVRSTPTLFQASMEAIGAGITRIFGYNQQISLALARRLLQTDPAARNEVLRRLSRRAGPVRFGRFVNGLRIMNRVTAASLPAPINQLQVQQGQAQ